MTSSAATGAQHDHLSAMTTSGANRRTQRRRPLSGISSDTDKGWVRRSMPLLRAYRIPLAASLVASLMAMATLVLFPRWLGYALDDALAAHSDRQVASLSTYLWVLLGITAVGLATGLLSRWLMMRVAYALEFDLRTLMYEHLARLSPSFFDRVHSGELISRANSDIRSLQMFLAFAPLVTVQLGMFFMALWFMLGIDVGLTLVAIAVLPAVLLIGLAMRRHLFPASWLAQSRLASIATLVEENVSGAQVVKAFAAERRQIILLARAAQRLRWAAVQVVRARARFDPLMANVVRIGQAAVLLYGGLLVLNGEIGPGAIVVFMTYLMMLQAPFRMAGLFVIMAQRAAASARRIYAVLDEEPGIVDRPDAHHLDKCRGEVELRDVHFSFGGAPVLTGIDLRIYAGQTVALVGSTGSGKTTLVQLIARLYDVDCGAVLVDGHDVRELTLSSLRQHIGVCFEDPFLFSGSVRDNIAYSDPDADNIAVIAAAKIADAHEFITSLPHGYDTLIGERGANISGGQRQRIAIARAILSSPRILILDDATSAIDVETERRIHNGLRELMTDRTTMIVAHRLSTIALADQIMFLADGRVVASGTHGELLNNEPDYAAAIAQLDEENRSKMARLEESSVVIPKPEVKPLDPDHLDDEDLD